MPIVKPAGRHVEVVETRVYTLTFEPEDGMMLDEVNALYEAGQLADSKWEFAETKEVEYLE